MGVRPVFPVAEVDSTLSRAPVHLPPMPPSGVLRELPLRQLRCQSGLCASSPGDVRLRQPLGSAAGRRAMVAGCRVDWRGPEAVRQPEAARAVQLDARRWRPAGLVPQLPADADDPVAGYRRQRRPLAAHRTRQTPADVHLARPGSGTRAQGWRGRHTRAWAGRTTRAWPGRTTRA